MRSDEFIVRDGTFADTKEQRTGSFVMPPDRDAALGRADFSVSRVTVGAAGFGSEAASP
jgi:hypothetical protein